MRAVPAEPPDMFLNNFSCFTEWSTEADSANDVL
jgi:hypothetical protein